MINNIYFDLDECLIHSTEPRKPNDYNLNLDEERYKVLKRPSTDIVLDYARKIVGEYRVWILTASTQRYCRAINSLHNLGFDEVQLLTREDIYYYLRSEKSPYIHADNILIDNLSFRMNDKKTSLLGINQDRYLQIESYYGANVKSQEEKFVEKIKQFIDKHNEN